MGGDSLVPVMNGDVSPPKKGKKKKIEDIYQKKTQLEHILLRPDTYIGSVETVKETMWVVDEEGKFEFREVTFVPGLYKIFDEILVNAADNKQRDKKMDTIKVDVDPEANQISIYNNGKGIPVVEHSEEKMHVPTLIFGHLLTSSNFDDEEEKVTGGRNGYGAKLCNVFSTKFMVETASRQNRKAFKQVWYNNMSKADDPKIKEFSGEDYTKITFQPDLTKFKMEKLDKDIVAIFQRRAYDVAATSGCKVILNGKRLPVKNFKEYVDLYLKDRTDEAGSPLKFHFEKVTDRWEIGCCLSENGFQQVSFVNSIATTKGGKHIDYVADMVVKNLTETIKKKNKNGVEMKPSQIKNHMWLFVNCLVVNPTFDSQTKEFMTLQSSKFGSKCQPSEGFYQKIMKSGIVEACVNWAKYKAEEKLGKMQKGTKKNKITGIPKLEDANEAGRAKSLDCTLILTEGDSAKTLAVAGLGVVGRDYYGVFPLRGKLLNVREASSKQIMDNAEISALVKIIGLQYKKKYDSQDDMKGLRYGKLMIMTDQDHDGSHIKGLIINFIHHNWPGLLKLGFIEEFITPIVKAIKGKHEVTFFSMPELEEWKRETPTWKKQWRLKYYKGLGTSTSKEAKEYFQDMRRHRIRFKYQGDTDDDSITMAFAKKCIERRKDWLTKYMEESKRRKEMGMAEDVIYSKDVRSITFSDFVNKELVLFSNLDNTRSIPSLVDGLKPGQRKVVYTCLKRNDKKEVKVAQLAGSVAEHSAYHHGEVSLMSTIIGLAQNFVGSNNINILMPNGQFGTRLQGGKDAASPRYIFTQLSPLAHHIFNAKDTPVLTTLYDDNQKIEPEYYVPIIPMVLVNGADGIGTGWMTRVPNFNPREIVQNLRRMIEGEEPRYMKPWYKSFRGEIVDVGNQRYAISGEVAILSNKEVEITELPIGTWTQNYKENILEPYLNGGEKQMITDYKEYHTDTTVRFVVSMKDEQHRQYEDQGFHKVFKLQTTMSLGSMVLFDHMGCIKKYETVLEILKEFFDLRMKYYNRRREYMLGLLEAEADKLKAMARFIVEKCDGTLVIENKKKKLILEELIAKKYPPDPVLLWRDAQAKLNLEEEEEEEEEEDPKKQKDAPEDGNKKHYDYLMNLSMWNLTMEQKEKLLQDRDKKLRELNDLRKKTPSDLYRDDLDEFMEALDKSEAEEAKEEREYNAKAKSAGLKLAANKKGKKLPEYAPSPKGERVAPSIDEMLKKAEMANRAKENKGKAKPKKAKEETDVVEKDEFDLMLEDADTSLRDKLDTSEDGPSKKPAAKAKANGNGVAKAKTSKDGLTQTKLNFKPAAGKKKKTGSDSEDEDEDDLFDIDDSDDGSDFGGGKKNTKKPASKPKSKKDDDVYDISDDSELASSPKKAPAKAKAAPKPRAKPKEKEAKPKKSPPKRTKKQAFSDSEDDNSDGSFSPSPKKKSPAKKRKTDSDSDVDNVVNMSDDDSFVAATARSRRGVAQKKYTFDSGSESE